MVWVAIRPDSLCPCPGQPAAFAPGNIGAYPGICRRPSGEYLPAEPPRSPTPPCDLSWAYFCCLERCKRGKLEAVSRKPCRQRGSVRDDGCGFGSRFGSAFRLSRGSRSREKTYMKPM